MAYYLLSFDGLTVPHNLGMGGSFDVATGNANIPLITLPGGRTYDPQGTDPSLTPPSLYTATLQVVNSDSTALVQAYEDWQAKKGVRGQLVRSAVVGLHTAYIYARLVNAAVRRVVQGPGGIFPIILTFQGVTYPWTGSSIAKTLASAAVSTTVYFDSVTNGGNARRREVTLTITANGGSMTHLVITNLTTGHSLVYTGTVLSGKSLVIDTGARSVKNDGTGDYAHLTPPSTYEDWFVLDPGSNSLSYQATFAGSSVTVAVSSSQAWA